MEGEHDMLIAPCGSSINEVQKHQIYVCTYAKNSKRSRRNPPKPTKYFAPYKNKKIQAVYEVDCLVNVKRDENGNFTMSIDRMAGKTSEAEARDRAENFLKSNRIGDFDNERFLLDECGMNLLLLSSKAETDYEPQVVQGPQYRRLIAKGLQPNTAMNLAEKNERQNAQALHAIRQATARKNQPQPQSPIT